MQQQDIPKKDKPWWANKDKLWGGETFEIKETDSSLGVNKGDVFRVEQNGAGKPECIPHPDNTGKWKHAHDKTKPIKMTERDTIKHERVFSMKVKLSEGGNDNEFFLVERKNGTLALMADDPETSEGNGGNASIRR